MEQQEFQTLDERPSWLDKVHDLISWRLYAPSLHTPFGDPIPTRVLEQYVERADLLKHKIALRGLVDGYEIVRIKDLDRLWFESDHLVVSKLTPADFIHYFDKNGVYFWIENQIAVIQEEYRQEIARRRAHAKSVSAEGETIKQRLARKARKAVSTDRRNRFYSGGKPKE